MEGVPKNLAAHVFEGARLVEIKPLENILYLVFERPTNYSGATPRPLNIGIEGEWCLRNAAGDTLISGYPIPLTTKPVLELVGSHVTRTSVRAPSSFGLTLNTGHELEIFASNRGQGCESFSIPELNVYV